jgi:hypothetical protein
VRGYLQCLVAFAAAAIIPVAAMAQEQGLRNRDRERQLDASRRIAGDLQRASVHRGAFYLLSSIQLADIGYTEDNEFWAPTRDHTSGVTFGINAPHRLYFIPRKKVIFALDAVPGYGFYRSEDVSGDKHFRAQFGYQTRASMQLLLNHLYLETYVGKSDTLRSNTGEINRILTLDDRTYGVNGELKYSSKTSALYSGAIRDIDYPDDAEQPDDRQVDLLGRREFSQRGSVTHKTFARTSLLVAGEASSYEFKRLESRDSKRMYGGAGVLYAGDRVSAGAEAGYARLSFDRPGSTDFGGVLGNVRGDVAIGRRWSINGAASRDVDFSIFGNNLYYVLDRANTAAVFRATQRLSLRGAVNVGRNKYDVLTSGVYRRDKLSFISLGFDYSLRRSRLGLEVGHYSRTSTIGDPPEDGIRMTIHLSLRP